MCSLRSCSFAVWLVLLTACLAANALPADAAVLFDNFGPGNTYDPLISWAITRDIVQGDAFTTPVGRPFRLSEIDLAAGLAGGGNPGLNELELMLMTSRNGVPDDIVESFLVTNVGDFGVVNPPLAAISVLHPLLLPDREYWVIARKPDQVGIIGWNLNSVGGMGPHVFRFGDGPWDLGENGRGPKLVAGFGCPSPCEPSPNEQGAFRVIGTQVGNEVPLPSMLHLLASGLSGLAGIAAWRKWRHM